jgi:hypothetical protein
MICDDCRQRVSGNDAMDGERPFPAFTVTGALLGSIGAAASGTLLIVPAAIVAGAALDAGRRCAVCGAEIGEDDGAYHLMEEMDDGLGTRSYRAAGPPAPTVARSRPTKRGIGRSQPCAKPPRQPVFGDSLGHAEEEPEEQHETRFVFDEIEGRLVQADPEPDDPLSDDAVLGTSLSNPQPDAFSVAEDLADGFLTEPETDFESVWEETDVAADWLPEPPTSPMEGFEP